MAKPEATFVSYIHKKLDPEIHRQSMYTPYSGGTPDCYYEHRRMALWIEYKFERQMPKIYRLNEKLSALQMQWLNRAHDNEQNVAVVVGFGKTDVVVFIDGAWDEAYSSEELQPHIISRKQFILDLAVYMRGGSMVLGGMQ